MHLELLALACLTAFVVADIVDGIVARRTGDETVSRRALDAVVDRAGIHVAFLSYAIAATTVPAVWIALLFRDAIQAMVSARGFRRGLVGTGDLWHKAIGLGTAAVGYCLILDADVPSPLNIALVLGIIWCTITYAISMRQLVNDDRIAGVVKIRSV